MPEITVSTPQGRLAGRRSDGLLRFHRVPYAAAPVGERRFAAPAAPSSWSGVRSAVDPGPVAVQPASPLRDERRGMDEDCLFLDIVTSSLDGSRPVIVWLHGGGYFAGSSLEPDSDGARLASEHGIVVVSVTHRLGVFGFLDLEPWGVGGSGLAGHLDLVAALRWIRRSIAAFGGDPGRVTVVGHSGGGGKASLLLSTPGASELLRGAVIMAGPEFDLNDPERATQTRDDLVAALGLGGEPDGFVAALRSVPAADLLQVQEHLGAGPVPGPDTMRFSPVVGRHPLPLGPTAAALAGLGADIPLIIGTARDESHIALGPDPGLASRDLSPEGILGLIADGLDRPEDAGRVRGTYRRLFPDLPSGELWLRIASDQFRIRSLRLAEARVAARAASTRVYRYDVPSPGGSAAHGAEVAAFFGWCPDPAAMDLLAAFAASGDPGPTWPAYSAESRQELRFRPNGPVCVRDPEGARRAAWDGISTGPRTHPWARLLEPAR